jgi:hypothetical protein
MFLFTRECFFPLIVFGGPEALSEDSLQESIIPVCSPSKDLQSTVAGEIAGFKLGTASLQSGVATNDPPLLPIHHYSSILCVKSMQ